MATLIEYRDIKPEHRQTINRLADAYSAKLRVNVILVQCSKGWEPAGSVARLVDKAYYAVRFMRDGAIHGQRFSTLTEAQARFDLLVS